MQETTILLVEDNANDEFLARRALSQLAIPHNLVVARDGVEALDYLFREDQDKGDSPAFVILDLKLPRIDGLEVLKEIRSRDKTKSLPVIILSSSDEQRDIKAARHLGATDYLVKSSDSRKYSETILKTCKALFGVLAS